MTVAPVLELAPVSEANSGRTDTVTLLSWYVCLLMIFPAWLVFKPLGGLGAPSTIFAAVLCVWYGLTCLHPAVAPQQARQPVRFAVIAFACAVLAAYVSANRIAMSTLAENAADRGVIDTVGWAGVLLLAADGIDTLDRLRTLLRRIVMAATLMSALAIAQFFTGLNIARYVAIPGMASLTQSGLVVITRGGLNRAAATTLSPLELAGVLAMCLPIAVYQARHAPPELRRRRWLQVALIGATLPTTVSRTAVIAFVVICLVLLPTWPKPDRRLAYLVIAVGVVGLSALEPSLPRIFRALFFGISSDPSAASRTNAFSSAMPFIAQHPWLGRGFGTFFPQIYFFTDDQYLLMLIEAGIVGLLALVMLFVTGWSTARRVRRASDDPEIRQLGQCLAASVAAGAVSFAMLDALSFQIAAGLTFLLIGCVGAAWRLVQRREASVSADPAFLTVR
jgi:O-antigen ligase